MSNVIPKVGMKVEGSDDYAKNLYIGAVDEEDKTYQLGFVAKDGRNKFSHSSSRYPWKALVDLGNGRIIHNYE